MKHLFTTLLLLIGSVMGAWGLSTDDFEYQIMENGTVIQIEKYKGNSHIISVPATIDGLPVTKIKSLSTTYNNETITEVYIPETVTTIKGVCIANTVNLQTIIIANGNLSSNSNAFNLSSCTKVNCIIVKGQCTLDANTLTGTSGNSSYKAAKITVKTKDSLPESITIYQKEKVNFDNESFDFLLSAIYYFGSKIADIEEIDLHNTKTVFGTENPAEKLPFGAKVKGANGKEYTNDQNIPDKSDFYAPATSVTNTIHYSRANTKEWNSVCLPFPIKESDFPGDTRIYEMTSATDASINLTRLEEGKVLPAGTPCFIYSDQGNWDLTIDCTISADVSPETVQEGGWKLKGSFTNYGLGEGKYKLNSDGTEFVKTTTGSTVTAFRCYLEPTSNNAAARLSVFVDEEASITLVPNDGEPQQVKLYDLMGRERKAGEPGIFLRARTY